MRFRARRAGLLALVPLVALASAGHARAAEVSKCAAQTYRPAEQPPFGGAEVPALRPVAGGRGPRGYELDPAQATAIARGPDNVAAELAEHPEARASVFTQGPCRWQVSFHADGSEIARVAVDDRTGKVLEAWTGQQVGAELARGYEGAVAQAVNSPWVWLPLTVLFLAPFFDPRRPRRLVHLDLAVIAALGVSLFFFNRAEITASVLLVYPVAGYVLARALWIGLRPAERGGPLLTWAPVRWLAIGAVLLGGARIALNVADSQVIDVGVASVAGADRITSGEELYEGGFSPGLDLRGDVYGPGNYLAYVPFEAAFPFEGEWDDVPAAHAAAIGFDLLVVAGLLVLGLRLRAGSAGRALGVALAFAWLACPWTLYALNANVNDGLVAASVTWALVALRSPAGRGLALAVGAAAKFGTAALAPLLATAQGLRDRRVALVFSAVFLGACALLFLPFLPDGGPREVYDRTLGYQAARGSPFSLYGQAPSLEFLQTVARLAAVALAVAVAFVPRTRTPVQVAALGAAVIVAVQLGATHWSYFYVVWFLPAYLVASFGEVASASPLSSGSGPWPRPDSRRNQGA